MVADKLPKQAQKITRKNIFNCIHQWPGFFKRGPWSPLRNTGWFSGGHKQGPSLGSFAVILHNQSIMIY